MWIRANGKDTSLPVLLVLHGGPGFPCSGMGRKYQELLEGHFIVVHWDMRGAGKSYRKNTPGHTMTLDQMVSDALEVVGLLKGQFKKEKICLLGFSFGTLIGLRLAHEYPGHFDVLFSSGQMLDMPGMEAASYQWVLGQAQKSGNKKAIRALEQVGFPPYKNTQGLMTVRKWTTRFGGNLYPHKSPWILIRDFILFAPHFSVRDKFKTLSGLKFSLNHLANEILSTDLSTIKELKIPVFIWAGRHDHITPVDVIEPFFQKLRAPAKGLYYLGHSGHMPLISENRKLQEGIISSFRQLNPAHVD